MPQSGQRTLMAHVRLEGLELSPAITRHGNRHGSAPERNWQRSAAGEVTWCNGSSVIRRIILPLVCVSFRIRWLDWRW